MWKSVKTKWTHTQILGGLLIVLSCAGEQKSSDADLALSANAVENGANSNEEAQGAAQGKNTKSKSDNGAGASDPYDNDWNNLNTAKKKQDKNAQQTKSNTAKNNFSIDQENTRANPQNASNTSAISNQMASNQIVANQAINGAGNTSLSNMPPVDEPPLDQEPAPRPFEMPVEPPPAVPLGVPTANQTPAPIASASSSAQESIIKSVNRPDLEPKTATLHWVGYDFSEREGLVRVQMVTRGSPKYNVFQERNKADQPELVVRFFNTSLRHKLRRDINASEFRSPVAYVRMRPNLEEAYVDVVMTLRDMVQPRLFNKYGNIMLTFQIPDRYFGTSTLGDSAVAQAQPFPNAHILPDIDQGSVEPEGLKVAKAFINNPGKDVFQTAPASGGDAIAPAPQPSPTPDLMPVGEDALAPEPAAPDQTTIGPVSPPANAMGGNIPAESGDGSDNSVFDTENSDFNTPTNKATSPENNVNFSQGSNGTQGTEQKNSGNENTEQNGQGAKSNGEDSDPDDTLDSDSLENMDNGKGESPNQSDKFDVRRHSKNGSEHYLTADSVIEEKEFTLVGVAQDNFADEENANKQNANANSNPNVAKNNNARGNAGSQNNFGGNANQNPNQAVNSNTGQNANATLNNAPGATNGTNPSLNANPSLNGGAGNLVNPPANVSQNLPANPAPANILANPIPAPSVPEPIAAPVEAPVLAPVAVDVSAGEPPIQGQPDLAGTEQVGTATEEPSTPSSGGRPIRLDFRGAPLSEVVRVLSEESGINFVMSPEVGQTKVFINLTGAPFNDALKAVLESNGLGMVEVSPNIVRIDRLTVLAQEKEDLERRRKVELKLRPEKILVHRLNYVDAAKAVPLLTEMLKKNGELNQFAVSTEARTNSIVVKAPASELATVKALLERIDLETPQVKIASRIVEVLKTAADGLGISWGGPFNFDQGRGLGFGNLVFPNYYLARYSVDAGGLDNSKVGNFQGRIGSLNNSMAFDLALALEETKGTSEVLQSSNLIVQDNEKATIVDGKTDYFPPPATTLNGTGGSVQGEAIRYNLTMDVQPHITADGAVQMDIDIKSDSPTASTASGARAATLNRSIKTKLLRRSGDTAVIGGVYTMSKIGKKQGIPFLQSIPIIGALFRSTESSESKKELLVLVTPTIISGARGSEGGGQGGDQGPALGTSSQGGIPAADMDQSTGGSFGTDSPGSLQTSQNNQGLNGGQNAGNGGTGGLNQGQNANAPQQNNQGE